MIEITSKKIIYLMHVSWGWIKQRPHFIAEELAKKYNVEVFFWTGFNRSNLTNNLNEKLTTISIIRLPGNRYKVIRYINNLIVSHFFKSRVNKEDILWVTHPSMFH